jgi:hypothetical protein
MAGDTCHGGRPSFPPPPVLGRSTLGAVDMPIGCALTFVCLLSVDGCRITALSTPQIARAYALRPGRSGRGRRTGGLLDETKAARSPREDCLHRRLALAGLALALTRFAAEEQRLADHRRDHRDLEWFCDQEGRLRALPGQEALRISGNEDHRHFK